MEVNLVQTHSWLHHLLAPLFEFHGKTHFIEFYLNFKITFSKEAFKMGLKSTIDFDGYQVQELPKPKEVKEVPQVVRECQESLNCLHRVLSSKWPLQMTLFAHLFGNLGSV